MFCEKLEFAESTSPDLDTYESQERQGLILDLRLVVDQERAMSTEVTLIDSGVIFEYLTDEPVVEESESGDVDLGDSLDLVVNVAAAEVLVGQVRVDREVDLGRLILYHAAILFLESVCFGGQMLVIAWSQVCFFGGSIFVPLTQEWVDSRFRERADVCQRSMDIVCLLKREVYGSATLSKFADGGSPLLRRRHWHLVAEAPR